MIFRSVVLTSYIVTFAAFAIYSVGSVRGWTSDFWLSLHEDAHQISWGGWPSRTRVRWHGPVTFTTDETAVATLAPEGRLEVEQRRTGRTYRIEVEPALDGPPRHTYLVDGDPATLDAEHRARFAALVQSVARNSGINADGRVARLLREGGPSRVQDEVDAIERRRTRERYLLELVAQAELPPTARIRLGAQIGALPSTSSRARVLSAVTPGSRETRSHLARDAYFDALDGMPSSSHRTAVLRDALAVSDGDVDWLRRIAVSAARIPSASRAASVLGGVADHAPVDPVLRDAIVQGSDAIPSPSHRADVLRRVVDRGCEAPDWVTAVTRATPGIASASSQGRVLAGVIACYHATTALRTAFVDAVQAIPSASGQGQTLRALLGRTDLDRASVTAAIETAAVIPSASQLADVLVAAAPHVGRDVTLAATYETAATAITSRSHRARALAAPRGRRVTGGVGSGHASAGGPWARVAHARAAQTDHHRVPCCSCRSSRTPRRAPSSRPSRTTVSPPCTSPA